MEPIKVRAYGVIDFTQKQYVITQSVVSVILIVLFIVSFFTDLNSLVFNFDFRIIIVIIAILEGIETFVMMKKFKEKSKNI